MIVILKNRTYDETFGENGCCEKFDSISAAKKYVRDNFKITPGDLRYTQVDYWRIWGGLSEEDLAGIKSIRVALYTKTGFRIETFDKNEDFVDRLPEILEILSRNVNKKRDIGKLILKNSEKEFMNLSQGTCDVIEKSVKAHDYDSIVMKYCDIYKTNKIVKIEDFTREGIGKPSLFKYFNSIDEIDTEARIKYPNKFKDVRLKSLLSDTSIKNLKSAIEDKSVKRFFITTAVAGCEVGEKEYYSVKNYCRVNNAMLLICVSEDSTLNVNNGIIDKMLKDEFIVFTDIAPGPLGR